jgi:hypothetical protein
MKAVVVIAFALLSSCGPKKGASDPTAVTVQEGDFEPPICEPGEVKLKYPKGEVPDVADEVDGRRVSDEPEYDEVVYQYGDYEFIHNSLEGGHALMKFGKEIKHKLLFAWQEGNVENGTPVGIRGYITTDKLDAGNCEDPAEFVSKLTFEQFLANASDISASFVLRKLRRHPYCTGVDFPKTIAGCFKKK